MRVYFSSLFNDLQEGELIENSSNFLQSIMLDSGKIVSMPASRELYNTREERDIQIFVKEAKLIGVEAVLSKYKFDKREAKIALDKAIELFPDKFI